MPAPMTPANRSGPSKPYDLPVPKEVWSTQPTLGQVPNGRYLGRVSAEAFAIGVGDQVAVGSTVVTPGIPGLAAKAAAVLKSTVPHGVEPAPWPAAPMRPDMAGRPFAGRVVVELWDTGAKVAIRVNQGDAADLIGRAARAFMLVPG